MWATLAAVSGFSRGVLLVVLVAVAALLASAPALASSRQDVTIASTDGTVLAATLTLPDGPVPQGGWPAVIFMHGLGQTRASGLAAETPRSPRHDGAAPAQIDAAQDVFGGRVGVHGLLPSSIFQSYAILHSTAIM